MHNRIHTMDGFTLMEVLIALVVLSIGILGVAGLQLKAQGFSREAYQRTQATVMAHDMLERMRSNPAGLGAGYYDLPQAKKHQACYGLSGCSTLQMAENDMYEWAGAATNSASKLLPGGAATVCLDTTPQDGTPAAPACDGKGKIYAIKVWWQGQNNQIHHIVTTAALK